jgi:serine/threonine protein kinase
MEYASGGSLSEYLHGADSEDSTWTGTNSTLAPSIGTQTNTGTSSADSEDSTWTTGGAAIRTELPRSELSLTEVLSILIDVARAMEFCYAQTPQVHRRDLKPQNVLRGKGGRWLVADFGVSKVNSSVTSTHTRGAMASPAYASPEQLDSEHRGEPSDMWSFGVIVWEVTHLLLTLLEF